MVTLNFIGGATPDVSVSFTDNWVRSTSGVSLPTNATLAANGNRPVYVATAECYWAGRGASRTLNLTIGTKKSANKTVAAASSASASGDIAIGFLAQNGGNAQVRIDGNGSFFFGRDASVGQSTDSYGTNFGGALSGSLEYYTVPTAPTSVAVSQATTENAVNVSWSAPSSNGGSAITSYTIQWAYNSNFTGATTIVTGSTATSRKITNLTYGSTVYVRVAAVNVVATAAATTSVYSSSANAYLVPPDLPLNGWANFGTLTNNSFTIERTSITALIPETGIVRRATASATGGSYSTGNFGIEKTYTGLTVGRQYIVSGKAILMTAGTPGNIYRFAVNGIGNGTSVTLTSTTVGATIPSYTFTATSTTHVVQIELAETFTVTATGTQEHVAFYDFALTRVAVDLAYRLQDNMINGTLVKHFDMATESVGAHWWVDKTNTTQFVQNFNYILPACEFSDVVADGNIYFNDIQVSYDTSTIINQILFRNAGRKLRSFGSDQYIPYEVDWLDTDSTSVNNWGARQYEMETNLQTTVSNYNLLFDPNLVYSANYYVQGAGGTVPPVASRQLLSAMATGATGFLSSGTTQPVNSGGAYVGRVIAGQNAPNVPLGYCGDVTNSQAYPGVPITGGAQYTGSVYMRAGVGHATSLTGRVTIRWYNEAGAFISDSNGTATTITATGWTRRTLTATAPATATAAVLFAWFLYGGTNNTGFRYYTTGAQLEQGATAGTWFSGDTADDASFVYQWEGTPGSSASIRYNNIMDTRTGELLTEFANPAVRIHSLKWNTAQNPVLAASLDIGSIVTITFKGTTANYRIAGITHEATPDNWHMTLQVAKEN